MSNGVISSRWTHRRGLGAVLVLVLALLLGTLGAAHVGAAPGSLTFADISPNYTSINPGEQKSFTITLRNETGANSTANVTVVVPDGLQYVPGSASSGGSAGSGGNIVWSDVGVPAGGDTKLRFKLTPSGSVATETEVRVLTLVDGDLGRAVIPAVVTLKPGAGAPPASDFGSSTFSVAPTAIGKGEQATYTLVLKNSDASTEDADVTIKLDARMTYVAGSAVPGGAIFDSSSNTLSWNDVAVAGGGSKTLTFKAEQRPDLFIMAPSEAKATATISSGGGNLSLTAIVVLLMMPITDPPVPVDPLAGSVKLVSRSLIGPGEEATYTIVLNNSGTSALKANVTDVVPAGLSLVAGSASPAASYDGASRTLSWSDIEVGAGKSVELAFRVVAASPVTERLTVVNKATIVAEGKTYERRSGPLSLVPAAPAPGSDVERPEVTSVVIEGGDVHTDRDVALKINATDNVGVVKMQVREWVLDRKLGPPRWRIVQDSGLIDYQTSLNWRLTDAPGTHFVGVWAQDAAGNFSVLDRGDLDFASLLVPGSTVDFRRATAYLVALEKGEKLSATLTTTSGDADLYGWFPGGFGIPDKRSIADGTGVDKIEFTAPAKGTYVIIVYGYAKGGSTYSLSITPSLAGALAAAPSAEPAAEKEILLAEPLLSIAGVDPLVTVQRNDGAPVEPKIYYYLPIVRR